MTGRGRPEQREALLDGAVQHVLREGVGTLSLRPIAAALGTSDRMLRYYFGSRDTFLAAILARVGAGLLDRLTMTLPTGLSRPDQLLTALWEVGTDATSEPMLWLYLEVLGLAAARREPFATAAAQIGAGWLAWAGEQMEVAPEQRDEAAAGVLAVFDGLMMLRFGVNAAESDRAARWAARIIATPPR